MSLGVLKGSMDVGKTMIKIVIEYLSFMALENSFVAAEVSNLDKGTCGRRDKVVYHSDMRSHRCLM